MLVSYTPGNQEILIDILAIFFTWPQPLVDNQYINQLLSFNGAKFFIERVV